MRVGTLLLFLHGIKGQGQSLPVKACGQETCYRSCPITFKFHILADDDERINSIDNGSLSKMSMSILLHPNRGCHALRCVVDVFRHSFALNYTQLTLDNCRKTFLLL